MRTSVEGWVVFAKDENGVKEALVILKSLRSGFTSKKVILILTEAIPESIWGELSKHFDEIFMLPKYYEDEINVKIQAKLFCLSMVSYHKMVFLPNSALVVQNSDEIFKIEGTYFGKYGTFVLEPSFENWGKLKREMSLSVDRLRKIDSALFERLIILELGALPLMEKYDFCFKSTDSPNELMVKNTHIVHFSNGLELTESSHEFIHSPYRNKLMEFKNQVDGFFSDHGNTSALNNWSENGRYETEPIAITGMSCRMPGANNVEEYWNILYNGECTVRPIPEGRWTKQNSFSRSYLHAKIQAGWLSCGVDEFDANFFRLSSKEMNFTDPQHRFLLEVTWESLEDAGVNPLSLKGTNTGVYSGIWIHDYNDLHVESAYFGSELFRAYMGNGFGVAPAKIAYYLGLSGPNIVTESGCSSSSVGIGLAIKALRSGETNLALACGVNLLLNPFTLAHLQGVLSPDFRCKTFDSEANGFARAEGCGALVLKRLSDAVRDGDRIHALIRGYGAFQEGDSRSMGTPTVNGEATAMKMAMEDAGVKPNKIQFIEAHGTGTALGDPTEVKAISQAFSTASKRKYPLIISSGKANIGHTESCAGIAGIIKTILCIQHKIIPQQINIKTLNPEFDISKIPGKIPLERMEWISESRRLAAVNSFGITGTDTCTILEEATYVSEMENYVVNFPENLCTISAQSELALQELLREYSKYLTENPNLILQDIAFTTNTGRAHFRHRVAIKAKSSSEIVAKIASKNYSKGFAPVEKQTEICFLFTGQGSQHSGMGQILYENFPIFASTFESCSEFLKLNHGIELKPYLWDINKKERLTPGCLYAQVSIFVIEFCMVKLWESLGIVPSSILGHSLGEFAAATTAGILTLHDALNLLVYRCQLIDTLPLGKMIAVNLNEEDAGHLLRTWLINQDSSCWIDIAAVNSPEQTTLAGPPEVILQFAQHCKTQNIKCTVLDSTHAFHSRAMDPIVEEYRKAAKTIQFNTANPNCLFISGVEGRELTQVDSEYWIRHTRSPVQFIQAAMVAEKHVVNEHYVEVGPHPVLCALMAGNLHKSTLKLFPSMRKYSNGPSAEFSTFMDTASKLHCNGFVIDFMELHRYHSKKKISLPFYKFQRKKFWLPSSGLNNGVVSMIKTENYFLLGRKFDTPLKVEGNQVVTFQNYLNLKKHPFLGDHRVGDLALFPAAGFIYLSANAAADTKLPFYSITLENLPIMAPFVVEDILLTEIQTIVTSKLKGSAEASKKMGSFNVGIYSHRQTEESQKGSWVQHVESEVTVTSVNIDGAAAKVDELESLRARINNPISTEKTYTKFANLGFNCGKYFQSIHKMWRSDATNEILVQVKVPSDVLGHGSLCHPVVIDSMFQTYIMTIGLDSIFLPIYIEKISLFREDKVEYHDAELEFATYYVHIQQVSGGSDKSTALYSENGKLLAIMHGLEIAKTDVLSFSNSLKKSKDHPDFFEDIWKPIDAFRSVVFETSILESEEKALLNISNAVAIKRNEKKYLEISNNISRCVGLGILKTFWKLGWVPEKIGESITNDYILHNLGIVSRKPFKQLLRIICEDGYFEESNLTPDTFKILHDFPGETDLNLELQEYFQIENGNAINQEMLILRTLFDTHLTKILRGEQSALNITFPEFHGDTFNLHQMYEVGELGKSINILFEAVLEHLIVSILKKLTIGNSGIKILEIGAGIGSTTQVVISILQKYNIEFSYVFTDISTVFLEDAKNKFKEYSNRIEFKHLDIQADPKLQEFAPNQFHLVIASQVLHATKDLTGTCHNIRQLTKEFGLLFIAETLKPLRLFDVTSGLLPQYWNFTDVNLRPNHCLIGEESWKTLLRNTGFSERILCEKVCCGDGALIIAEATSNTVECSSRSQHELPSSTENWITFGNSSHLKEEFVKKLSSNRINVISFDEGESIPEISDCNQQICFKSKNCVKSMFKYVSSKCEPDGIVFFLGLEGEKTVEHTSFVEESMETVEKFLNLLQTILEMNFKRIPRLYLVTRGKASITDCQKLPNSSLLVGMFRSFVSENGSFICKIIDLDPNQDTLSAQIDEMFSELWTNHEEPMVAFRDGIRHVTRITGTKIQKYFPPLEIPLLRFELVFGVSKTVADIKFCKSSKKEIHPFSVEIEVRASGLNFRNVFSVLKPTETFQDSNYVGEDYAGIIIDVGSQVTRWKVGDRVAGLNKANEGLPSHVLDNESNLISIPTFMTFEEAATFPTALLTAYHCLITFAQLKRDETVLIHTASGGVGLMAIQVARNVGAKIIATAGSNRKRCFLRNMGVLNVFNSRNLSFGDEIQKITNGFGVDVVLNSLTGPGFKETSLKSCAKEARFIEMSKLNIWSVDEVFDIRPDVFYKVANLTYDDANRTIQLLTDLDYFKVIHAIPVARFAAANIREALITLEKALHIGKVVLTMPKYIEGKMTFYPFNKESCYLITGGTKGIGLELLKWMCSLGAENFVIMARNDPPESSLREICCLKETGKNIMSMKADVGNFEQCKQVFEFIQETMPPLRGVMHCAGLISDATFQNQSIEKYREVLTPKLNGGWNLHLLTQNSPLEHFVMFSSATVIVGGPGQSNYNAANTFLDTLAHYRVRNGLPATSINWSQWGEVGFASGKTLWTTPLTTKECLTALHDALSSNKTQFTFMHGKDIRAIASAGPPSMRTYVQLLGSGADSNSFANNPGNISTEAFWEELDKCEVDEERISVIQSNISRIVSSIISMDPNEKLDPRQNFRELGVDSLMMIQLKNNLQHLMGSRIMISTNELIESTNVDLVTKKLFKRIFEGISESDNLPPDLRNKLILEDSKLWDHISICEDTLPATKIAEISTVFITGVTGNFGPYLLEKLGSMPQIKTVYCLVRFSRKLNGEEKLMEHLKLLKLEDRINLSKVKVVEGDITVDKMGIEIEEYGKLAKVVEMVVHCAVYSNHVGRYTSESKCRNVNVTGTQRILEFASRGRIKHFYHSSSILGMWIPIDVVATTKIVEDWPIDGGTENAPDFAYGISKFVADRLVAQAVERGIPCKAFRFTKIFGDSKTGRLQMLKNHFALKFLYYIRTGMMPDLEIPLQVFSADAAADVTLRVFFHEEADSGMYNVVNPHHFMEFDIGKFTIEFGPQLRIAEKFIQIRDDIDTFKTGGLNAGNNKKLLELLWKQISVEDVDYDLLEKYAAEYEITDKLLSNPASLLENEVIKRYLENQFGYEMSIVKFEVFEEQLKKDGESSLLFPWLEFYTRKDSLYKMANSDLVNDKKQWIKDSTMMLYDGKIAKLIPELKEIVESPLETVRKMIEFTIRNSQEIFS